jgi:hypothetical protein
MARRLLGSPFVVFCAVVGVLPIAALGFFGHDEVYLGFNLHFYGVGMSALAATIAAATLTIAGARRRDGRTVLVGTGFSVMAALLAVHGLTTPGVLVGMNGVISFSGAATLPVGGLVLALSTLPPLRRPSTVGGLLTLQATLLTAILGLGLIGILLPDLVPSVPEPGGAIAQTTLVAGLVFYALLGWRAVKTYRLTRRGADLLVVLGIVWLTASLGPALLLHYDELGWWLGHLFELLGIALVGAAVAADLYRGAQSRPLAGDLRAAELVSEEEAFLGAQVRALTRLLAERDEYTEQHTRRVALRAVQVGEELGLSPERLRSLAAGGLLHDMGKLSVPDAILEKPGALTDEEYGVIKEHPESGRRLLEELGGFASSVLRLVSDHHERLDGNGYPQGADEEALDLETRILTVCDVYDALISKRVYRDAWPHERAIGLLHEETGTAFDPRCVAALERVLESERESVAEPLLQAAQRLAEPLPTR